MNSSLRETQVNLVLKEWLSSEASVVIQAGDLFWSQPVARGQGRVKRLSESGCVRNDFPSS